MSCDRDVMAFSTEVALCGFQFCPCFSFHQFMNKHCVWDLTFMLEGAPKTVEFVEMLRGL